jgi:hypothetical protein
VTFFSNGGKLKVFRVWQNVANRKNHFIRKRRVRSFVRMSIVMTISRWFGQRIHGMAFY